MLVVPSRVDGEGPLKPQEDAREVLRFAQDDNAIKLNQFPSHGSFISDASLVFTKSSLT